MKNMSLEESNEAMNKALENAQELLNEATILLNNECFARAYTLAHLALEETEKVVMIAYVAMGNILGYEVDWKHFDKRIRDHKAKINGALVNDKFFARKSDVGLKEYIDFYGSYKENSGKSIRNLNDLKNNSIYTGFINNKFCKPSEVITKNMAVEHIKKGNKLIDYHEKMLTNVQGTLSAINENPEIKNEFRVLFEKTWAEWEEKIIN